MRLRLGAVLVLAACLQLHIVQASPQPNPKQYLGPALLDLLVSHLDVTDDAATPAEGDGSGLTILAGLKETLGSWFPAKTTAWQQGVVLPFMDMFERLVGLRPALKRIYFNYWNATFHQYAEYAEEARVQAGLSPNGPLLLDLVDQFRVATGTTCVAAAFVPPAQEVATITGREVVFTLSGGNCQVTRVAIQTRKDLVTRCVLPVASLAITQPRYSSKFVSPATFASSVCRRQFSYGLDSTATLDLWNPGDLAADGAATQYLPLSDADGNGVPNFLDKLGKLSAVREALQGLRSDLTTRVFRTTTAADVIGRKLQAALQASGLDVVLSEGATRRSGRRAARQAVRQEALRDLTQLFPGIQAWPLGTGVTRVFDQVLEHGVVSSLYRTGATRRGPFTLFLNTQPAGSSPRVRAAGGPDDPGFASMFFNTTTGGSTTGGDRSGEGTRDGEGGTAWDAPSDDMGALQEDIFKTLADEMDKLLMQRRVAQELADEPPTGRKVTTPKASTAPPSGPDTSAGTAQVNGSAPAVSPAEAAAAMQQLVAAAAEAFAAAAVRGGVPGGVPSPHADSDESDGGVAVPHSQQHP